jgi:hypothetical protein
VFVGDQLTRCCFFGFFGLSLIIKLTIRIIIIIIVMNNYYGMMYGTDSQ